MGIERAVAQARITHERLLRRPILSRGAHYSACCNGPCAFLGRLAQLRLPPRAPEDGTGHRPPAVSINQEGGENAGPYGLFQRGHAGQVLASRRVPGTMQRISPGLICGLEHVRETIPFPRMLYKIYP